MNSDINFVHCHRILGNDQISGGNGDDTIYGDAGLDKLYGDAGNDHLYSGSQNTELYGGLGNDYLYAQGGEDRLYGGGGIDYLRGGVSNDDYWFQKGDGTAYIEDAQGIKDEIYMYGYTYSDLSSFTFTSTATDLQINDANGLAVDIQNFFASTEKIVETLYIVTQDAGIFEADLSSFA